MFELSKCQSLYHLILNRIDVSNWLKSSSSHKSSGIYGNILDRSPTCITQCRIVCAHICHRYFSLRKYFEFREYNEKKFKILAASVTTFLLLDIGLSISYPTVLISALTGRNNKTNPDEYLRMTPVQVSWMGKFHASVTSQQQLFFKFSIFDYFR